MIDARGELLAALQALVGVPCARSLAINSLKFRFDFRAGEKGRAYLWLEPPWRLTLAGVYVTGSGDWPRWDGVAEPEANRPLGQAWCGLFDPLDATTLAGFEVGVRQPDLRLRFASGHEVETFGADGEYWWYYRDRLTGKVFEARPLGITCEDGEPAED